MHRVLLRTHLEPRKLSSLLADPAHCLDVKLRETLPTIPVRAVPSQLRFSGRVNLDPQKVKHPKGASVTDHEQLGSPCWSTVGMNPGII